MKDISAVNGKTLTVPVSVNSSGSLCAAVFDISFDSEMLEFQGVKTRSPARVFYSVTDCGVRVVYAGLNDKTYGTVFSLSFKSLKSGSSEISYIASDCADCSAQWLDVGACSGSRVSISASKAQPAASKRINETANKTDKKSATVTNPDSISDKISFKKIPKEHVDEKNSFPVFLWIGIGVSAASLAFLMFLFGRKTARGSGDLPPNTDDGF